MDLIKKIFAKEFVVFFAKDLPHPKQIAIKIKNNEITWDKSLFIYFSLLTISIFITNSIFELHLNGKALNSLKLAFFETLYIFIFSAVIRGVMLLLKRTISYEKTLKICFIYGGMIHLINSILMIFAIYLQEGGNRFIVFLVSILSAIWIFLALWSILDINEINGRFKKIVIILFLLLLFHLLSLVLSVITPYFIILK